MEKGKFIVIEGTVDGAGKSTLARSLIQELVARKFPVWSTFEIGGSPGIGETIRQWTVDRDLPCALDPAAELFLILADRAQHSARIKELIAHGVWVVSDRYTLSTVAYQGWILDKLGLDPVIAQNDLEPDLTVLLDLPVVKMRERLQGKPPDHFEQQSDDTFEAIRERYLNVAWGDSNTLILDATLPKEVLLEETVRALFPAP